MTQVLLDPTRMPEAAHSGPLQGRIALVTGAASGLGAAICEVLTAAGARVIGADVRRDRLEKATEGFEVEPMELDVADEASARRGVGELLERHGRLDILVNNAGIDRTVSIEELEVDDWDRVLAVNLRGPFLLSKLVLPAMREAGSGHIVNITSTAAKRAWQNAAAYHASKWGLLGFSHALHTEARPHGVKVTAVVAGGMRTPFLLERFPDIDIETLQDPRNVADTVRFVLSQPPETVIPEVMVLPMRESSWP
jgi:NAD(P)-dependent dehydrogenase (short-subunit alcohol dehydrogenase family)